jgi:hypothetical protein
MREVDIDHLGNLHKDWTQGLEFYHLEFIILQDRLDEIAADNTGKEVSEKIEYFQNHIIIHRNYIDELRHYINGSIHKMGEELLKTGVFINENTAIEHMKLNEQYITEEKMISELRYSFNRFAAEWM